MSKCLGIKEFVFDTTGARQIEVLRAIVSGFGGLVVSMLASGTRLRGFEPGRTRWIFRVSEKSSACLPSEGK